MTKLVTIQSQQKWECCVESRMTETSLTIESNRLGQEGWELVSVLYYKDPKGAMVWSGFFKRPSAGQAHAGRGRPAGRRGAAGRPAGGPVGQARTRPRRLRPQR